jgi:hypothetical protein
MITVFIYIAVAVCISFGVYVLINLIKNFETLRNK